MCLHYTVNSKQLSNAAAAAAAACLQAPAAGGCSADELAGLVVEVQLQLLEVLESAAGLAARAGATERAEQWSARADALARQLL